MRPRTPVRVRRTQHHAAHYAKVRLRLLMPATMARQGATPTAANSRRSVEVNGHCPILIIAGTHDRIVAARTLTALHERLPGSKITTTATGHLRPIDDPDSVADAVLRALRYEYRNSLSTSPSTARRAAAGPEPQSTRIEISDDVRYNCLRPGGRHRLDAHRSTRRQPSAPVSTQSPGGPTTTN